MPELPEVETVRRTLEHQILNEKIIKVDVYYAGIIQNQEPEEFKKCLIGQSIKRIFRYGKYLFFILDDVTIISHLRMEGKYFIKKEIEQLNPHEHIIFHFISQRTLRYHDTRKFGTMRVVKTTDINLLLKEPEIAKLGKEANDLTFTADELYNALQHKSMTIKQALLDQSIISGLGNIYVDEVCFLSNLSPMMKCTQITKYDCANILNNSKIVLTKAIEAGGTTIRSYTSSLGVTGRFQLNLYVHTKEGKECTKCHSIILKTKVGGRGTYYCPTCQKLNRPVIVGITGGIATGKSAVSKYLINKGYEVIDTDKISRSLTTDNEQIKQQIKKAFGEEYFEQNSLNRKKLGDLIFTNRDANKQLSAILHPVIKEIVVEQIKKSNQDLIFVDVPLLFESGFDELCNKIICVSTTRPIVIKRLMKRDQICEEIALIKINSQMALSLKQEKSNFIIDNSNDLCYTYKQIDQIVKKLI